MLKVRLAFCILGLLVTWARGDDISLVRVGEVWRYCRGTNEPSSPVTAWRQPSFDDSSWQEGQSGFSTTAYSDTAEATLWNQLAPAPVARTFYLRREFTVADPQAVKWLILRLDYTHGFVAYLNGQEIARRGLANDPVAHDDYADYHFSSTAEEFDVSAFASLLNVGQNVLAIEVHTAVTNPPGYASSMRLVPELLANFQRGPFVANASTNSIQVIWRTPVPADSVVDFGAHQAQGDELFAQPPAGQVADATLTTNHVITLTGLQPGTEYLYRVRSTAGGVTVESPLFSFHTFKASGDVTFLVAADTEDGSVKKYQLSQVMAQNPADLVVHCGDLMYNSFRLGSEDYRTFSVYGSQMRSVPFYFTMGDHDLNPTSLDQPFLETFNLPTNSVTGTEHFYSFDQGDAHFAVLFLPTMQTVRGLEPYQLTNGSPQYCWLTNDLAKSTKPWKFLFMHLPFASSGYHTDDDNNNNGIPDAIELQSWLLPISQRYGVQLVFSGHEHDYERSNPMGGVYHVVVGGGGGFQPNYYFVEGRGPANSQFYLTPAFVKVAVHGDSLLLQAIGTNGAVFDYMTIQRSAPPPQVYTAAWRTPLVESTPANDGHGNINGETFDFSGTPIPARAGDFSNLGRVYVNHDATNLYIGLEQTMIYSNQNISLFIESSRQGGVTNLAGLGDGLSGTDEGVDGLDFLENLAFTNFTPSLACLLGDEYGDGEDRHFARPGLPGLDLGQGVFRLDTTFSDVPGVRVQQFNSSPQVLEPPRQLQFPERNANFIKVAIPLSELGGLQSGDTIKLAAVVGMAGCDTNGQTRELDTGFLGQSMAGAGESNVLLEPVSVRLAPAVLTVKADDQTRAYGDANPPLTVSYSGFLNGQDTNLLSGSPLVTTTADTNSPEGTYPITVSQGTLQVTDPNYTVEFVGGSLKVVVPATIVSGPSDQMATNGATVLLTVTAQGTEPRACQWYYNETISLPGATNFTLVLSNVTPAQAGSYSAVLTNPYGWASNTANLVVVTLPTITCGSDRNVELGTPWDFDTPTATGSNVTVSVVSTTTNTFSGESFTATRTWVATDANGFQASCSQTVTVLAPPEPPCSGANYILSIARSTPDTFTLSLMGTTNAQYYCTRGD